jgi:hypothetical protein
VPEPAVRAGDPRGQPVADDIGDRAWGEVEEVTRTPVSILPPRSPSSAASAAVIDRDPPAATGQPYRWPTVMMPSPIAEVSG